MKIIKNTIILLALLPLLSACEDMFSPAQENHRGLEEMYDEPSYAQGLLGYAYSMLPYSNTSITDIATDDAVTNDLNSSYISMATGSWSAINNPMDKWQGCRAAIQYVNLFLSIVDQVKWAEDKNAHTMYCDRLKGEAYALRAVNIYFLLQAHGGWTAEGQLLGIPNVTEPEDVATDFNQERATFQECIEQLFLDVKTALELLPDTYYDLTDPTLIPQKYVEMGVTNVGDYNRVNGSHMRGRINAHIVKAIRAQAALLAASPAYQDGTNVEWADAADYAADLLDDLGGLDGLDADGYKWYMNKTEIDNLSAGDVPQEILWRADVDNSSESYSIGLQQERDNFPPSLYGSGRINPTQNLVDAFPMANGYPISDIVNSGYSASNPYMNRDPRLDEYILYNGSTYKETTIITGTYATNNDGVNKESGYSTRTGYYMRKLLRDDCNANPSNLQAQKHLPVRIRATEIFLAYAEAANEAWGPTGKGTANAHAYSAYDVIKAIRARAGVGVNNSDPYLESIKNSKDNMRTLIRNERRIELCFENKRFYDLRRWKVNLNEVAKGMQIDKQGDGNLNYISLDVEKRDYKDYMYYGPIPNGEVLKWSNLEQNKGW